MKARICRANLVVKAGYKQPESELIWVKGEKGLEYFLLLCLCLLLPTLKFIRIWGRVGNSRLLIRMVGLTPGTELTNEQWVYTDPDQIFVSASNKRL